MGIIERFLIYLVIGMVVATALWVAHGRTLGVAAVFDLLMWVMLWPFFAPLLFGQALASDSPRDQGVIAVGTSPLGGARVEIRLSNVQKIVQG